VKIEESTKRLKRALKRLQPEQGRRARQNARRAVLEALRAVRHALDIEYPLPRKELTAAQRAKLSKALSGSAKQRADWKQQDLLEAGYVELTQVQEATARKACCKLTYVGPRVFVPGWVHALIVAKVTLKDLRKARTSIKHRKILLARAALAKDDKPNRWELPPGTNIRFLGNQEPPRMKHYVRAS
jgi:hypothetical protein